MLMMSVQFNNNLVCFCCQLTFFSKLTFFKKKKKKKKSGTLLEPNGLNPDQDLRFIGPDLGPNCLQKLSADDKNRR